MKTHKTYKYADTGKSFAISKIYSAFKNKYGSDYSFVGEYHNFWEILIVTSGEVGVTSGSNIYTLKKGQGIIHEPMEFHNLWSLSGTSPTIIVFSFGASLMPTYQSKVFEIPDLSAPNKILSEFKLHFEICEDYVVGTNNPNSINSQIATKQLEIFILDSLHNHQKFESTNKSTTSSNYHTIVKLLEENIDKKLSIPMLAAMCNMSKINLQKTFTKYTGMGVIQYFNHQKILKAMTMLKEGKTSKEVADTLGFSNQNYFCTVFKRITGRLPSDYKKK